MSTGQDLDLEFKRVYRRVRSQHGHGEQQLVRCLRITCKLVDLRNVRVLRDYIDVFFLDKLCDLSLLIDVNFRLFCLNLLFRHLLGLFELRLSFYLLAFHNLLRGLFNRLKRLLLRFKFLGL